MGLRPGQPTGRVTLVFTDIEGSTVYQAVFDWPRNARIDYDDYIELCAPDGTLGLCERETYASLTQATNTDVTP